MPPMEEGRYYGQLVEIGTDHLDNDNKTPFVFVTWNVTHRAVDGQWVPIEPVHRESRWWTSEKAEPYTMDRLVRLGFNGDFDSPQFTASPHPQEEGVELVCRHSIRNEQAYENWDLAGSQDRERTPWGAEAKRLFKAKYRTRLASEKKPAGMPPAPPARPAAAAQTSPQPNGDTSPIRDEEIPDLEEQLDVPDSEIPF
jgi:hypothetical protein